MLHVNLAHFSGDLLAAVAVAVVIVGALLAEDGLAPRHVVNHVVVADQTLANCNNTKGMKLRKAYEYISRPPCLVSLAVGNEEKWSLERESMSYAS